MKEMVKIVNDVKKNPEEKQYLVCIATIPGSGENDSWVILNGRTETYKYIKENIDIIDLNHSFVLVETLPLDKRKSIYAFMKHVGDLYEDNFDIEDYVNGDWDEDDYIKMNDISINIDNSERLSMQSFMDGNVETTDLN